MIQFDLSEISEQSELFVELNEIQSLLYHQSVQTTNFLSHTGNLRTGLKPDEGQLISNLPYADAVKEFLSNAIVKEQNTTDDILSDVYTDTVFQYLVATGYIPLAWLYLNSKVADIKLEQLKKTWDMLVISSANNYSANFVYTRFKSFGMVSQKVAGHDEEELLFYLIPSNNSNGEYLTSWISNNHIWNVLVLDEKTFDSYLVDKTHTFLFQFDRVTSPYNGVTFRIKTKLKESVPTYLVSIGCNQNSVFLDKNDFDKYEIVNSHYRTIEVKRNEPVTVTLSVPENYTVDFVSINGSVYFVNGTDIGGVGVTITEVNDSVINGYKIYNVTISGISISSKIYISTCEDLTGKPATYKVISSKRSTMEVHEEDVTINLIFNDPFLVLDSDRIHVYGRKDDDYEWEKISDVNVMVDGLSYVERKAVFGTTRFPHGDHVDLRDKDEAKPMLIGFEPRNNPYVKSYPPRRRDRNVPMEAKPESRAILYGVSECGSAIITITGYTDYKYFLLRFDDRAMITHHKVPGRMDDGVDMIPVVENMMFTNDTLPEETEEPKEETPSTGEESGSVDTPEVSGGEDTTPVTPSEGTDETESGTEGTDSEKETTEPSTSEEPKESGEDNSNTTEETPSKEDTGNESKEEPSTDDTEKKEENPEASTGEEKSEEV